MGAHFLIYCDGGCPNNGQYGKAKMFGSFAVYKAEEEQEFLHVNEELHEKLHEREPYHFEHKFDIVSEKKHESPTNNIAEASTMFTALSYARSAGLLRRGNTLTVCCDSQLIINHITGAYKCNSLALKGIYKAIYAMLKDESTRQGYNVERAIRFVWIPGTSMKQTIIEH